MLKKPIEHEDYADLTESFVPHRDAVYSETVTCENRKYRYYHIKKPHLILMVAVMLLLVGVAVAAIIRFGLTAITKVKAIETQTLPGTTRVSEHVTIAQQRHATETERAAYRAAVVIFYSPLNDHSQRMITDTLYPLYANLTSLAKLEFCAFGGAKLIDGSIECEGGPRECELAWYQTCLIAAVGNEIALENIACMLDSPAIGDDDVPVAEICPLDEISATEQFNECYLDVEEQRDVVAALSMIVKQLVQPDAVSSSPWMIVNNVSRRDWQNHLSHDALLPFLKEMAVYSETNSLGIN